MHIFAILKLLLSKIAHEDSLTLQYGSLPIENFNVIINKSTIKITALLYTCSS